MMSANQKELWRNRWLSCVNELTSLVLQQKSWTDQSNTNPHWSFVEFMCSYFDDLSIDNNYENQLNQSWITKTEFEIISKWHCLLEEYKAPAHDYDLEAILKDENWLSIVSEGLRAKQLLNKVIAEEEVLILNEEINHTKSG